MDVTCLCAALDSQNWHSCVAILHHRRHDVTAIYNSRTGSCQDETDRQTGRKIINGFKCLVNRRGSPHDERHTNRQPYSSFWIFCHHFASSVFSCHRPLELVLSKGGPGIFNVRIDLNACCAHEGDTGTDESPQVLTWKKLKTFLHPVVSGSRTLPADWPSRTLTNRPWAPISHHHHHLSLNRDGRWGTTDDFATSFLHFPLFSTALWDLPNSRPDYSLMLSSHLFLCLPCLLPPFTVPPISITSQSRVDLLQFVDLCQVESTCHRRYTRGKYGETTECHRRLCVLFS